MTLYKQVHNDWFTIRGAFGVKVVIYPGEVVNTAAPPAEWMDAYQRMQERGRRGLTPFEDFDAEIRHWTKGRNPLFVVTSQAALDEEKRLKELAAKAEEAEKTTSTKKKSTKKKTNVE